MAADAAVRITATSDQRPRLRFVELTDSCEIKVPPCLQTDLLLNDENTTPTLATGLERDAEP